MKAQYLYRWTQSVYICPRECTITAAQENCALVSVWCKAIAHLCVRLLLLLLCKRERRYCAWLRWHVCVSGIISCFIISNGFTAMAVASVPGARGQRVCVCLCACGYSPWDHCASLRASGILPHIDPSIYSRHKGKPTQSFTACGSHQSIPVICVCAQWGFTSRDFWGVCGLLIII